ncbi:MAG: hypothetical protein LH472_00595 [Pyrinomonadaceae bacterium]|nr:hypothetical protein [Pyrinomonadaceae bacterium]
MKSEIEEKLKILQELYKSDFLHPFPYDDCRKVLKQNDNQFEDLIPCLDVYLSDVAGFCSWGKRIADWSNEQVADAAIKLGKSFFDRFNKFSELKPQINDVETPTLYNQLLIFDLMRLTLTDILSEIKLAGRSQIGGKSKSSIVS